MFLLLPLRGAARLLALVPMILLAACGDDPAAPEPARPVPTALQFSLASPAQVIVGAHLPLGVTVLDQMGRPMDEAGATVSSRDTTTLSVDSAAVLYGVAGGETWVVAAWGPLRDSLQVSVRYHVLPGEARLRIVRGATSREIALEEPLSFTADVLGSDQRDRTLALFMDGSLFSSRTLALLVLHELRTGEYDLAPAGPEALDGTVEEMPVPTAFVEAIDDDGAHRLYLPIAGSRLTLEEARVAASPGNTGRLDGRVVLRAEVYAMESTPYGPPTPEPVGDTATAYLDFSAEPELQPVGQASFVLEGGPDEGSYGNSPPSGTPGMGWRAAPSGSVRTDPSSPSR